MGRPSRKRPRPAPSPAKFVPAVLRPPLPPSVSCRFEECGTLQSLVINPTTPVVQQVWGALTQAEVTHATATATATATAAGASTGASPGIPMGVHLEVDSVGAAWLLNTPNLPGRAPSAISSAAPAAYGPTPRPPEDAGGEGPTPAPALSLCDPSLRAQLSTLKEEFDDIDPVVFKRARSACNPAEALGSGPFLNRSAMKLANLDAIAELLPGGARPVPQSRWSSHDDRCEPHRISAGSPSIENHGVEKPWRSDKEAKGEIVGVARGKDSGERARCRRTKSPSPPPQLLRFADLCGGPGGFSEYLLRRRRQFGLPAQGWGISLRENSIEPRPSYNDSAITSGGSSDRESSFRGESVGSEGYAAEPGAGSVGKLSTETEMDGSPGQCSEDPCAWRLDRIGPWCSVLVGGGRDPSGNPTDWIVNGRLPDAPVEAKLGAGSSTGRDARRGEKGITESGQESAATKVPPAELPGVCLSGTDKGGSIDETRTTGNSRVPSQATATPTAAPPIRVDADGPFVEMRIDFGPRGTGDLTDEVNMCGFVSNVLASTGGVGLDLVVADGGFGAARDARDQEQLLSPLVHSEALTALLLLAEGGSFVCKLFEVWTETMACLVYLLHRKFRRISILKPITSRPASGERYLVCTGMLPQPLGRCRLTEYLTAKVRGWKHFRSGSVAEGGCSPEVSSSRCSGDGVVALGAADCGGKDFVDVESEMKDDAAFLSYLRLVNDRLASVQANACAQIIRMSSSKRGRAWAFRGHTLKNKSSSSNGTSSNGAGACAPGAAVGGGEWESDDDVEASKCFVQAWRLDEI